MGNFLDAARDTFAGNKAGKHADAFEEVFAAIGDLQAVHSKSSALDLTNLESVFGAFEMARMLGRLPGPRVSTVDRLPDSMVRVIVRTLEATLRFQPRQAGEEKLRPPAPYPAFVENLVEQQLKAEPMNSVAVLTFNYDPAVEYALEYQASVKGAPTKPYYGLDGAIQKPEKSIPVLKLHGSVAWFRCTCSGAPRIVPASPLEAFNHGVPSPSSDNTFVYASLSQMENQSVPGCSCKRGVPVIVPPSWSKGHHYEAIANVWKSAARELQEAENIVVIGYSLPPSDGFFPLLYGLGTAGDKPLRRFIVANPDPMVCERFRGLLGPGVQRQFVPISTLSRQLGRERIDVPVQFATTITAVRGILNGESEHEWRTESR